MRPTSPVDLDKAVETVGNQKDAWVRVTVRERIALAAGCVRGTLSSIERNGCPRLADGAVRRLAGGQLAVRVFPGGLYDRLMFPGSWSDVWMEPDVDGAGLPETMAVAYRRPGPGKLALVLGAGNVASIGPMDVLHKLFVENQVVVLKMHPVNEYLGPLIGRAFEPIVSAGYLRIVYGDAAEGQYLVHHPGVDEIHMTGSVAVHDRIVWGDTPEEQVRRRAQREPKVARRVTSELGCVTPVVVVPGAWSPREIAYQAENIATMVANNASCNCNAAKLLVTWRGWAQRRTFLDTVATLLAALPPRKAFYPGAARRYAQFTAHPRSSGAAAAGDLLSCATIFDVDPAASGDVVFHEEAWCPVIAETALEADDEAAFVGNAVAFCNDRVAGTLSAVVLASPESSRRLGSRLDDGIAAMRYGTVAVNHWAAASYVLAVAPWGAFPGHTLDEVGSGIGFVHNTFMFDRPQKTVLWGPFTITPKPAWFATHRRGHVAGRRMAEFEAARSVPRFASLAAAALRPN